MLKSYGRYDSVIVTGDLRWQDRLNNYNLPFFIPSSGFFTNYTWPRDFPSLTAQYFLSLDPTIMGRSKRLRDIFVGVDVWGRGQHGGGGFGSFRAISHIDPEFLGLSVALFGQAWTWETEQDKPGFTWETWWDYERKLWVGLKEGEVVYLPPDNHRPGVPVCQHGSFVPLSSFFPRNPPPNPAELPFFTCFSPGIGRAWFVRGAKVLQTEHGWTDVDKNTSLGDMVWPQPLPQWEHDAQVDPFGEASAALCMDDAWLGGSSLRISLSVPGSDAEDAFFRCLWLPVQSLAITPRKSYMMTLVYKVQVEDAIHLDIGISAKALTSTIIVPFDINPTTAGDSGDLPLGWTRLDVEFSLPVDSPTDILASAGLVIGFALEDPTATVDLSILIGSLSVSSETASPTLSVHQPKILWADFQPAPPEIGINPLSGTLSWEVAASFAPLNNIPISADRENPEPLWKLETSFPSFAYFNIYVISHAQNGSTTVAHDAIFIGTTGLIGREHVFHVDSACLPDFLDTEAATRFYIQGVTDRGHVLDWDRCAFVDVGA